MNHEEFAEQMRAEEIVDMEQQTLLEILEREAKIIHRQASHYRAKNNEINELPDNQPEYV